MPVWLYLFFHQFNSFSRIREQGRSSQSEQLHIFCVQSMNRLLDDEVAIYKNVTPGSGPVSSKADLFPSGKKTLFSWKSNEHQGFIKCAEPYLGCHSWNFQMRNNCFASWLTFILCCVQAAHGQRKSVSWVVLQEIYAVVESRGSKIKLQTKPLNLYDGWRCMPEGQD